MNRIQSKDHGIRTYKVNKISLSYFDDKIYIQNNRIWISSWFLELIIKNSYLNNYLEKLFCQAYCFHFFYSQNSFFCQSIKILSDFWLDIVNLKNAKHFKER